MAEDERTDEVTGSAVGPARWPDPSRPIVNQRPPETPGWGGSPSFGTPPQSLPRSRRRALIIAGLVVLVVALVTVWLLWWR